MSAPETVFWLCALLVLYPYFLYPLALWVLARLMGRPVRRGGGGPRTVSFVLCARDEQPAIERRILELVDLLDRTDCEGEIVVVSDGSSDDTAALVRLHSKKYVRLLEILDRVGKAEALSRGAALARNEVLVFADVRQTWADDALERLLEGFADPAVGAVSGDLVVEAGPGVMTGVGLYWRYEKWLRRQESLLRAQVGVTGAICAVRRELFAPIPSGTLLDDVYWPLAVAMAGHRVVHDERAVAYDRLPDKTQDEFRRKVRTQAGNLQLAVRMPAALLPWRNPVWVQFLSHKLARLLVPWALLGLLGSNALLLESPLFAGLFAVQVLAYAVAVAGLFIPGGKLMSAASSFLVLNAASWLAFWVWIGGRSGSAWQKTNYTSGAVSEAEPWSLSDEPVRNRCSRH
ncbi:MAG: glycosyltransferase [Gemmataceae bacterium]